MRTRSLARRSVAVVATTALITGGLATGMLASPAYAAPGDPATITSFSPSSWDNRSTVPLTINGADFFNADPSGLLRDTVELKPVVPDAAHEVGSITATANQSRNTDVLTVNVPLAMAPPLPGGYKIIVHHANGGAASVPAAGIFSIYAFGAANASSVAFGPNNSTSTADARGDRPLDIRGSNFAVGAKVAFLKPNGQEDTSLTFVQRNPGNTSNPPQTEDAGGSAFTHTGYPSTSLLQGNYDAALNIDGTNAFAPGMHSLRVYNSNETLATTSGTTATFSQPYFAANGAIAPSRIGVGAQSVILTVTGAGIRDGSQLTVQKLGPTSCADVSMGQSTVSGNDGLGTHNTISAPVSFAACSATGLRTVTITGPDGGSFTRSGLTVGGAPHLTTVEAAYSTLGQGAKVGYGTDGIWQPGEGVDLEGTNFVGLNETDSALMTKFDFGPGVTVKTRSVGSGSALVTIDVASDATVGERSVVTTNPDGGSTTTSKPPITEDPFGVAPFIVEAGPQATKVTPSGFDPSQSGTGVTVTGSFLTDHTYSVSVNRPAGTVNISGVAVTNATTLTFSMSTNGATPGPMDLTITDTGNFGQFVCVSCMGINSLTVTAVNGIPVVGTAAAQNNGPVTLTLQGTDPVLGPLSNGASPPTIATLTRQVPLPDANANLITASSVTAAAANQATAAFDLTLAAPGRYNVTIVDPSTSKSWSCSGCFTVAGAGPITVTSVTPNTAGQGVTNRLVTVVGTNFAKGMTVSIPDVTVHDITLDPTTPTTKFTFKVDVADNAPTGAKTATIASGDGSSPASSTGSQQTTTFTVSSKPTGLGGLTPAQYAQGAGSNGTPVPFSLTADPHTLQAGAVVSLGAGITATTTGVTEGCVFPDDLLSGCSATTPDELTATLVIAEAVTPEKRALTVTNPDGGSATLPDAFTIAAGPKVTSVANETGAPYLKPDGLDHTITVLGSGFVASPKTTVKILKLDGTVDDKLHYDASAATVEAGKITLTVKADTDAVLAGRLITVSNSDAGKGFGSCNTCVAVAKAPGVPGSLTLVPGASSLTAHWTAAAANGSPVTTYHLTIRRGGTTLVIPSDVSGSTLTKTFTGLANGVTYAVSVQAVNAAGAGTPASKVGIPGIVTTLTAAASTKLTTAGTTMTFSGKLLHSGLPVANHYVNLLFTPSVGAAFTKKALTSSTGAWSYKFTPAYTFYMKASFPVDNTYRASSAPTILVQVKARVLRTAPANGSTSSASTVLKIAGNVYPNKHGVYVYLYRYVNGSRFFVARTVLTSSSTFVFSGTPGKGTYVYRVYIANTKGNLANYSDAFTIKRV